MDAWSNAMNEITDALDMERLTPRPSKVTIWMANRGGQRYTIHECLSIRNADHQFGGDAYGDTFGDVYKKDGRWWACPYDDTIETAHAYRSGAILALVKRAGFDNYWFESDAREARKYGDMEVLRESGIKF